MKHKHANFVTVYDSAAVRNCSLYAWVCAYKWLILYANVRVGDINVLAHSLPDKLIGWIPYQAEVTTRYTFTLGGFK